MNETIKNILERRSVRGYTDEPVKQEDLELIVECGQYAATGMGMQPWHFSVVTNRELLDKFTEGNRAIMMAGDARMKEMASAPGFDAWRGAPAAVIVSGNGPSAAADCANATQNMAVAAWSMGIGSCYLGSFKICLDSPEYSHLAAEAGVPEGYTPYYALALGYSAETPSDRAPRKDGAVNYVK